MKEAARTFSGMWSPSARELGLFRPTAVLPRRRPDLHACFIFTVPVRYRPTGCDDARDSAVITVNSDSPGEEVRAVGVSGVASCPNPVIDHDGLTGAYAFPPAVAENCSGTAGVRNAELCGESATQSCVRMPSTNVSEGNPLPVGSEDQLRISSKGINLPSQPSYRFVDQPWVVTSACGNEVPYPVNLETLPSTGTEGSNPRSEYRAIAKDANLQGSDSFGLGPCDLLEIRLQLNDSSSPTCPLKQKGKSCPLASECRSTNCKRPTGGKTCK